MRGDKQQDDFTLEFTKSNKGLGDQYADEYARKLFAQNKDVFDESDLTGADSALKHEIDNMFNGLMRNLNQLSNVHFTPKRLTKETTIRTQNVPSLKLEEAIPIGVSMGNSKSAKEIFEINPKAFRDKAELSKEEKRRERAHRKRSIKTHLKNKDIKQKEKNREKGLALVGDRFLVKQVKNQVAKKKKGEKSEVVENADKNKNAFKSSKFFKNMEDVSKKDKERKELKKKAHDAGMAMESFHNN